MQRAVFHGTIFRVGTKKEYYILHETGGRPYPLFVGKVLWDLREYK